MILNFLRKLFYNSPDFSPYSEFEHWISNTLDVPIGRLSIDRYYIKDGVWYCHEQCYLDNRTVVDDISAMNAKWSTKRVRDATNDEIESYQMYVERENATDELY